MLAINRPIYCNAGSCVDIPDCLTLLSRRGSELGAHVESGPDIVYNLKSSLVIKMDNQNGAFSE